MPSRWTPRRHEQSLYIIVGKQSHMRGRSTGRPADKADHQAHAMLPSSRLLIAKPSSRGAVIGVIISLGQSVRYAMVRLSAKPSSSGTTLVCGRPAWVSSGQGSQEQRQSRRDSLSISSSVKIVRLSLVSRCCLSFDSFILGQCRVRGATVSNVQGFWQETVQFGAMHAIPSRRCIAGELPRTWGAPVFQGSRGQMYLSLPKNSLCSIIAGGPPHSQPPL